MIPLALAAFQKATGINLEVIALKLGIAAVLLFSAYMAGLIHEKRHDESKALRAELATVRQDLTIAQGSSAYASIQAADIAGSDNANRKIIDDLRSAIAAGNEKPPMEAVQCPAAPKAVVQCKPPVIDTWRYRRLRKLREPSPDRAAASGDTGIRAKR